MTTRGPLLALTLLLAAAASLPPPAAAQGDAEPFDLTVELADFAEPLRPLADHAKAEVTVRASCAAVVASGGNLPVDLAVADKPHWLGLTFSPARVFLTSDGCTEGDVATNATLLAQATAEAPAFTETPYTVVATTPGPPAGEATAEGAAVAGYYSILAATTESPVLAAQPQEVVDVPITVHNQGNGATTITVTVANAASDGPHVVLPGTFTVESEQTGGTPKRTVTVSVQTPYKNGHVNREDAITLVLTGHYALDQKLQGDSDQVTIMINTKGLHVPAPSAAAGLLAGLVAAVALMRRPRAPRP